MNEFDRISLQKKYDNTWKRIEYLEEVIIDYQEVGRDTSEIEEEIAELENIAHNLAYPLGLLNYK